MTVTYFTSRDFRHRFQRPLRTVSIGQILFFFIKRRRPTSLMRRRLKQMSYANTHIYIRYALSLVLLPVLPK